MNLTVADTLLTLVAIYLSAGVVFAIPFVLRGAARLDPAAGPASRGFRLAILPGSVALWPLLALRWLDASRRTSGSTTVVGSAPAATSESTPSPASVARVPVGGTRARGRS